MSDIRAITDLPDMTARTIPIDLSRLDIPHPRPYVLDLRTRDDEVSRAVAHVSNVEFVRWLDRAAELHADTMGFTREAMLQQGIMWFVARHEIDYLAEAHPGDELVVATWVRDTRRVRSWRDYVIFRPSDGEEVCRAATLWVLVDLESRRPIRIPQTMLDNLDALVPPGRSP